MLTVADIEILLKLLNTEILDILNHEPSANVALTRLGPLFRVRAKLEKMQGEDEIILNSDNFDLQSP